MRRREPQPTMQQPLQMQDDWAASVLQHDPMRLYRQKRDDAHRSVASKYNILGFISSGTYGRVYKAQSLDDGEGAIHAIKKFKPDKEGDVVTYTGISQSAVREIQLNREIDHVNVVKLKEVILEEKSIFMVFDYAEHDFLQVIHHHAQTLRASISTPVLKSLVYQLLNGLIYLHSCHILHRDLKPANILITSSGIVKIGDLGLARLVSEPLQPLFAGDKVVVTIWYRAPELLMAAKHYTKAVDCWAVGCVMAELASLRPIFKGEEAKLDSKKNVPFQRDQLLKIFEVMGTPSESDWPGVVDMPEYQNMKRLDHFANRFGHWCNSRISSPAGCDLLRQLFRYDPDKRLTAKAALGHKWFHEEPRPTWNSFASIPPHQIPPHRRITQDDAPSMMPMASTSLQQQQQLQSQQQQQHPAQQHLAQQHLAQHHQQHHQQVHQQHMPVQFGVVVGPGNGNGGHSKPGSSASFASNVSVGGGAGAAAAAGGSGDHQRRKKQRLG